MASIKGIELKGLKKITGHEGEPLFQGNIYFNGKKVGFYSEGDWGGQSNVNFDSKEVSAKVKEVVDAYFKENPSEFTHHTSVEDFMDDLASYTRDEKDYKSAVKKGYSAFLIAQTKYEVGVTKPMTVPTAYSIPPNLATEEELAKFKKELNEKGYDDIKVYNKLEDFIIK